MKILVRLKKAFGYSILDDLLEYGAERIERLPSGYQFESSPVGLYIDSFCIENDSRVYVYDDSIVVGRSNNAKLTRIPISLLAVNLDPSESTFSRNSRPFKLGALKIGFGNQVDRHLEKTIRERPSN